MTVLDLHDARTEQIPVYQPPLRRHRRSRARRVLRWLAFLLFMFAAGAAGGWLGEYLAVTGRG